MRIFLTGATGYIGAGVLDAFVRAGHDVTGLVRTVEKARRVTERGARPVVADLCDPASYRDLADAHDVYVHTGRDHSARSADVERLTLETLAELAREPRTSGQERVIIYTSGLWVLGKTPDPAD